MKMHQLIALTIIMILSAAITTGLACRAALGAPPPGADPDSATAQWYRSLERPDVGGSCCDAADCRAYEDDKVRVREGAYEVFIESEWRRVPPDKILKGRPNPTGNAVACWLPSTDILCFIEPYMT